MAPAARADFGFANSQCARWLDPSLASEEPARRQWLFGYLTGLARCGDRDLTYLDPDDAIARLRAFCAANPTQSLETAVLTEIMHD